MGTANFYLKNASRNYAVLMNYERPVVDSEGNETEETETHYPEEWERDDLIGELQCELQDTPFEYDEMERKDGERNFCGQYFAELSSRKSFAGAEVSITLECVMRSGYYEGAILDFEPSWSIHGCEYNEEEPTEQDLIEDFSFLAELNKGMAVIQARNAHKWMQAEYDRLVEAVEDVYSQLSTPMVVFARFSNGETMYKKAETA